MRRTLTVVLSILLAALTLGATQTPIPGQIVFPQPQQDNTFYQDFIVDASAERFGWIVVVPKSGTLVGIECRLGAGTGTVTNGIRTSLQNVDTATGNPDGTEDQFVVTTSTGAASWFSSGAMTSDGTGGGSKRTVTAGDLVAIVATIENFQAGNRFDVSGGFWIGPEVYPARGLLQSRTYNGASWSGAQTVLPLVALRYDDGTYPAINVGYPAKAVTSMSFHSGSTGDERGLLLEMPVGVSISGAYVQGEINADVDLVLYDSGGTAQRTARLYAAVAGPFSYHQQVAWTPYDLAAAAQARLVLKPATTTTSTMKYFDVESNARLGGYAGGEDWVYTERTDAGAWSETTTRRPIMGLVISAIRSGGGETSHTFSAQLRPDVPTWRAGGAEAWRRLVAGRHTTRP